MPWALGTYFGVGKAEDESKASHPMPALKQLFPKKFGSDMIFIENLYERRQSIVDLYAKYPELNDHAIWLLMGKLLTDTYLGIGHSQSDVCSFIRVFSTSNISIATAQRKFTAARDAGALCHYDPDGNVKKRRYMMSEQWIKVHTEFWAGVRKDAVKPRSV